MKPMQVVIPMSGSGQRFRQAGYSLPKPLLDVAGKPLIERQLEQYPRDWKFVFIPSEEQMKTTPLREVLSKLAPGATIAPIPAHKLGPVHTVLAAKDAIQDDLPTFINYCDFSFSWDAADFASFAERTRCDGALLCYKGFHAHYLRETLYAYCREEGGRAMEVREKGHFTPDRLNEYASAGFHYFRSGKLAKEYCARSQREETPIKGEHYMSLVYNPMIRDRKKILVYEIPFFLQWGTPEDLEDYLYWHRAFERFGTWENVWPAKGPRLIMPMAGAGSRFKGFDLPKPLVPVLGQPMYKTAQRFLPRSSDPEVLVVRTPLHAEVKANSPQAEIVVLEQLTPGQADTTLQALSKVKPDEPVLVSACDHGLLWDPAEWSSLLRSGPDAIVVGQRGYPGAARKPLQFSYIQAGSDGRISGVTVKSPQTDRPERELVLVGTFYVRRADILQKGIEELIRRDVRVNGERYLDSVISIWIEQGLNVRCFESKAFLNWGSPEALAEFSYWHRYFQGTPA